MGEESEGTTVGAAEEGGAEVEDARRRHGERGAIEGNWL